MKVTIMGAGVSGATLAYLLKQRGINFEIYDIPSHLHCGLGSPCGFGVNYQDFLETCELLKLSAAKYILRRELFAFLDGVKVKTDMAAIDKPGLIHDLLGDSQVIYEPPKDYDLLVDATGVARAYSETLESDFRVLTTQRRVRLSQPVSPHLIFSSGVGYAWLIPLSPDGLEAHLGAGALKNDNLQAIINNLIERVRVRPEEAICSCGAWIRATGPILPMVNENTITIGEAAGLVSPLSGGGNIPAMISAFSLASNLNDLRQYEREMVHRFGYFRTEERVLKSLAAGKVITPRNMIAMRGMLKFVGIYPTFPQYWQILQTIKHRLAKP